ncbi:glycoside hydrolase family 38 C-terminal domain-containing protein [Oceanobacillus oncorhynchi]|uniref:glycoside hydrolase family 38 N-terminal domain-containing protein n=1 Tax=Oceanobacillus oncorhynchi TaxID=545501 RepID=UPI0025A3A3D7|nr:glycoside hydrolase family 38 C-terminal domain-containing protein [Oceanobacillus oncorhynchi]MDM8099165.1 glycoside hydrolase family 38 C-terminal domain-containing protein [Oceanobacillus oncorhynchi]
MTNVHIVNHTHWDREWYFTSMDALVLSDQLFSDAIDELLSNPQASFVLDGQLSILDEYVELYPERLTDIKRLIAQKQLFIGPWYTQTDAFFTSGESILRNAMIGVFESKKYGDYMPIGYLPDTFGFNAQIPVILKEAGLDNVVLWRGVHLGKHVQSPYFKWRGLGDHQEIYALNLPQGYGTGMLLEPTTEYVAGRLDPAVDFIKKFTDTEDILIPSGNDQLAIITNFNGKVKSINQLGRYHYQVSSYQDFLEKIKQKDLETYVGEFRSPVLARVHKTIGSVRMDIKQSIYQLEQKLIKRIEPILVIANQLGIRFSNRLLLKAWKKLLESQAHDSLAGCVSDSVAEDIRHRLKEANEISDSMENTIMKQMAEALKLTNEDILLLNTEPHKFRGYKTIQVLTKRKDIHFYDRDFTIEKVDYVDSRENILEETPAGNRYITEPGYYILTIRLACELPGLGYRVLSFGYSEYSAQELVRTEIKEIANSYMMLSFKENELVLERNEAIITDFISIYDEGNAGDTYDYSPIYGDESIRLDYKNAEVHKADGMQQMKVFGEIQLPHNMEDRLAGAKTVKFPFLITFTLAEDDCIRGNLNFINTVLNHRMRLKINAGSRIRKATAALPFGYIRRTNQSQKGWENTYSEKPVNVEPFDGIVSVETVNNTITFHTKDTKEYEYRENDLYITLFATTDSLGKPDLAYRPGRASGDTTKRGHIMMETPSAQLLNKNMQYNFAINIGNEAFSEEAVTEWRRYEESPSVYYQLQDFNYFINRIDNKIQPKRQELTLTETRFSLLEIDNQYFVSSCYNSYYYPEKFIIRLENPTYQSVAINELMDKFKDSNISNVTPINAMEETVDASEEIKPYSVVSFLVELKEKKKQ